MGIKLIKKNLVQKKAFIKKYKLKTVKNKKGKYSYKQVKNKLNSCTYLLNYFRRQFCTFA